jgi:hypothetical protein
VIICFDYIHAQQRRYLVFAHVSDRVNLLREQFQDCLATAALALTHLTDEKKTISLRQAADTPRDY